MWLKYSLLNLRGSFLAVQACPCRVKLFAFSNNKYYAIDSGLLQSFPSTLVPQTGFAENDSHSQVFAASNQILINYSLFLSDELTFSVFVQQLFSSGGVKLKCCQRKSDIWLLNLMDFIPYVSTLFIKTIRKV